MKCIKTKCRYCSEHMFRSSILICQLDDSRFKQDTAKECVIPKKIKSLERSIEFLNKYSKSIEFKGKRI